VSTVRQAKEIPMLFKPEMVRSILSGRKTQTRRPVPDLWESRVPFAFPPWRAGDRIWVRETWAPIPAERPWGYWTNPKWVGRNYWYAADNDKPTWGGRWQPSIFMPREACRLKLDVTDVRAERVQSISEEDAIAEDLLFPDRFAVAWDEMFQARGYPWASNPWVWVISFSRAAMPERVIHEHDPIF
jgi:hypothetical protein